MTVYMPPIARKKRVDDRYNPDTFRVMSTEAEACHPKFESHPYRASFEPPTPQEPLFPEICVPCTRVLPHATADYRRNRPHPQSNSFIRTNARLLNEPVSVVHTKATDPEQSRWWPARENEGTLQCPDYTKDSTYRNDFLYSKQLAPLPSFRNSANPALNPVRGIVPLHFLREEDGSQRMYKEGLSFEHQYNSRTDPNYPIRGKRHGAFVWDRVDKQDAQKFIDYHTKLNNECPIVTNFGSPRLEPTPVGFPHRASSLANVRATNMPPTGSDESASTYTSPTAHQEQHPAAELQNLTSLSGQACQPEYTGG